MHSLRLLSLVLVASMALAASSLGGGVAAFAQEAASTAAEDQGTEPAADGEVEEAAEPSEADDTTTDGEEGAEGAVEGAPPAEAQPDATVIEEPVDTATPVAPVEEGPRVGERTAYGAFEPMPFADAGLTELEIGGLVLLGCGLAGTGAGGVLWSQGEAAPGATTLAIGAGVTLVGAVLVYLGTELGEGKPEDPATPPTEPPLGPSVFWTPEMGVVAGVRGHF